MNNNETKIDVMDECLRILNGWLNDPDGEEWEPYFNPTLLSLLILIEQSKMDLKNTSVEELLNIIFISIQKQVADEKEEE
jgi:hypothetical protein